MQDIPKSQYDDFADKYHQGRHAIFKEYVVKPTLAKIVGNLQGKSVIDFGCGSGDSTRVLKSFCHSGPTIGVDASSKEIVIARQIEENAPLGIKYSVGDLTNLDLTQFDKFEVATAVFVLNYAQTKEQLFTMCTNVFDTILSGSQFFALLPNPAMPVILSTKYEISASMDLPGREGTIRRVTHYDKGGKLYHFDHHYWSKQTYTDTLTAVGFTKIEWVEPIVSQAGLERFGSEFWQEFLEQPYQVGIICQKP